MPSLNHTLVFSECILSLDCCGGINRRVGAPATSSGRHCLGPLVFAKCRAAYEYTRKHPILERRLERIGENNWRSRKCKRSSLDLVSEAEYGLYCLKAHPLAKAIFTALSIPYQVRHSQKVSRGHHSCRSGLVIEERAQVQSEREQFGSDNAIRVQLSKGRPISYKHYIGKGAFCVYNEDAPGRSSLCRHLSGEGPVPSVLFQIMHQENSF